MNTKAVISMKSCSDIYQIFGTNLWFWKYSFACTRVMIFKSFFHIKTTCFFCRNVKMFSASLKYNRLKTVLTKVNQSLPSRTNLLIVQTPRILKFISLSYEYQTYYKSNGKFYSSSWYEFFHLCFRQHILISWSFRETLILYINSTSKHSDTCIHTLPKTI